MTCLFSPQVLKYYSTMAEAVARRLEQLRSRARLWDGDGRELLGQLRGGREPRLARAEGGFTLLHYACINGWLDFVKSLIHEHSCDPHAVTLGGRTPLHYACRYGRFDIVRYLISEQHCDPDCCDSRQRTPLHWVSGAYRVCTQEEAVKIVKFLVSLVNCDVSKRDEDGDIALHIACRDSQAGEMVIHCLTHCCHVPVVCINNNCNKKLISNLENVVRGIYIVHVIIVCIQINTQNRMN